MNSNDNKLYCIRTLLSLSIAVSLSSCGGGSSTPTTSDPVNNAPVISSLDTTPAEAFNGDTIALTANATDADSADTLTYDFSTNLGDITETTNTDSTSSIDCVEGLTTINVTVSDGTATATDSASVICNLNATEVQESLVTNLGLTNVTDSGTVDGMAIDFSATATDGTVLGFAYSSAQDFSNHNDISARGVSGTPQRVISLSSEADSSALPTTFDSAQDLLVMAATTKSKASNPSVLKAGTGDPEDICVTITADETLEGEIENVSQTGSYIFEGRDIGSSTSTLSFEDGLYSFPVAADGTVDLSALAGEVYGNVGSGVEELLNGTETNVDSVVNDVCDTSVLINPFTNTNPTVVVDTVTYSETLADGTTPRDIGSVLVDFTVADADEGDTNLTTSGTVSSTGLDTSVDLVADSTELEADLLTLSGATDATVDLTVQDSNGGSGTASHSIGVVDANDPPECDPVSLSQDLVQGESVTLIDSANCSDPEGDAVTLSGNTTDTGSLGAYSQTVTVEDEYGASTEYAISGEIISDNVAPVCSQDSVPTFQRGSGVQSLEAYLSCTDDNDDTVTLSNTDVDTTDVATGSYEQTVTGDDGNGGTDEVVADYNIGNTAPAYSSGLSNTSCDVDETITLPSASFTDVNGDSVTQVYSTSGTSSASYTCPSSAQTVQYKVTGSDGELSTDSSLFDIVVSALPNNVPVITQQPINLGCTNGDTLIDIVTLSGIAATDADNDSLTYTSSVGANYSCVNAGGVFDPIVTQSYNVEVTDGQDPVTSNTKTIYVCPTGLSFDGSDGCN